MMMMMYTYFGLSCLALLGMLIYFPDVPPTPPSRSAAATHKVPFRQTLKQLFGCRDFWLLALACGIANGINGGMQSIISVILGNNPWNMSDAVFISPSNWLQSAAWLGMWGSLIGVACGFAIGPIADRLPRWWKHILIVLLVVTGASELWFAGVVFQLVPFSNHGILFLAYILGSAALQATMPVFIEFAADVAYPAQAGATDGGIQFTYNVGTFIFQCVGFDPSVLNQHPDVLVWLVPAAVVFSLGLLLLVKGNRTRRHLDAKGEDGATPSLLPVVN